MRLSNQNFALLFTFLYAFLLACFLPFHELWIDETEPWLLALHSNSYAELLYNKRFEGHPNLWYSLLYVVTRFTDNLAALKISHYFFSVSFVFVFLRHAPFHWAIQLLFCFGYYGIFEYGVISRLYAPELLTLFLACALYPKRFTHWYLYIFILVLNAQTHLFGLYFSGMMGLLLFTESLQLWKNAPHWERIRPVTFGLGALLWLVGCLFSLWSITHYLGAVHGHIWDPYKFHQASTRIWQAFFPVPEIIVQFWNTSFLKTRIEIPLSLLLLTLVTFCFRPKKLLSILLILYAALFYFFAFRFELALRHHAHFFLFTVALFWISTYYGRYTPSLNLKRLFTQDTKIRILNLLLLLAVSVQFLVGMYAVYMEVRYSFFPGKAAAHYLKEEFPHHLLTTNEEFTSSTVGAYLNQPIYNLARGQYVTFYELDPMLFNRLTLFQSLQWAMAFAQEKQKQVILISSREIVIEHFPFPVRPVKSFDKEQIVALPFYRNIYLYEVMPSSLHKFTYVVGNPSQM